MVVVEPGRIEDAETVADHWVDLADDQRQYGSHLLAAENRESIRDAFARSAVAGELLVARERVTGDDDSEGNDDAEGKDEPDEDGEPDGNDGTDGTNEPGGNDGAGGTNEPDGNDEEDGRIVGFVTFGVESGRYRENATRGVVENVFVVPDRRGEGVGSNLLAAAERRLANAGVDVASLEAMAGNEAAVRFYRRHGYSPHRIELEKSIESDTLTKE